MEKRHLNRRIEQMEAEGTVVPHERERRRRHHRRGVARASSTRSCSPAARPTGATCRSPGRELNGHLPGDGVPAAVEPRAGRRPRRVAHHVGGQARRDHRRRRHRRRLPRHRAPPGRGVDPPVRDHAAARRTSDPSANPWPTWPLIMRTSSAHEEGGERVFSVNTEKFVGDEDGNVRALVAHEVEFVDGKFVKIEGSDFELPAERVYLAMGFLGPEPGGLLEEPRRRARRAVEREAQRRRGCRRSTASSSPATWAAARADRVGHRRRPQLRGRRRPVAHGRHGAAGAAAPDRPPPDVVEWSSRRTGSRRARRVGALRRSGRHPDGRHRHRRDGELPAIGRQREHARRVRRQPRGRSHGRRVTASVGSTPRRRSRRGRVRPEHDEPALRVHARRRPHAVAPATRSSARVSTTTPTSRRGCWPRATPEPASCSPTSTRTPVACRSTRLRRC